MATFKSFKARGDLWKDVEPTEQYEGGPAPIAPIAYSAECKLTPRLIRMPFRQGSHGLLQNRVLGAGDL